MLEQILQHEEAFTPQASLSAQATLTDFEAEYGRSIDDPETFWGTGRRATRGPNPGIR